MIITIIIEMMKSVILLQDNAEIKYPIPGWTFDIEFLFEIQNIPIRYTGNVFIILNVPLSFLHHVFTSCFNDRL